MQSFDLKEFRDLNNLSQLDTADYFGCTQGFISQIERKKRPLPDDYISKAIADESKLIPEKHAPPTPAESPPSATDMRDIKIEMMQERINQMLKREKELVLEIAELRYIVKKKNEIGNK